MPSVIDRVRADARAAETQLATLAAAAAAPAPEAVAAPEAPAANEPVAERGAHVVETAAPAPTSAQADDATARALAEAEQRERTLQGMFNKQGEQLQLLQRQIDRLIKDGQQRDAEVTKRQTEGASKLVREEDVKEFGEDTIDLMRRVTREVLGAVFGPFEQRLRTLEATVKDVGGKATMAAETTADIAEEKFFNALGARVADWQAINTDKKFLDWLRKMDMISGVARYDLLQDAFHKLNVERVAAIFNGFKAETGIGAPAGESAKGSGAVDLSMLASPGAAPTASSGGPKTPRIWTTAEVEKVYDDYQRGRTTKDEFVKLEAEAQLALREGRVR